MKRGIGNAGVLCVLLGGVVMLVLPLRAALADVPFPEIPKAKGERCVEPPEVMRRHHMDFILHHRDEVVHQGIRTERYDLTGCIDCHVTPGPDGEYPHVTSKKHFCAACHQYAAVRIDCFECHADHPQPDAEPARFRGHPETGSLRAHPALLAVKTPPGVVQHDPQQR